MNAAGLQQAGLAARIITEKRGLVDFNRQAINMRMQRALAGFSRPRRAPRFRLGGRISYAAVLQDRICWFESNPSLQFACPGAWPAALSVMEGAV